MSFLPAGLPPGCAGEPGLCSGTAAAPAAGRTTAIAAAAATATPLPAVVSRNSWSSSRSVCGSQECPPCVSFNLLLLALSVHQLAVPDQGCPLPLPCRLQRSRSSSSRFTGRKGRTAAGVGGRGLCLGVWGSHRAQRGTAGACRHGMRGAWILKMLPGTRPRAFPLLQPASQPKPAALLCACPARTALVPCRCWLRRRTMWGQRW